MSEVRSQKHSRRQFLLGSAATALSLAGGLPTAGASENARKRPNFIIMLADDLGYRDLGCFGAPLISTPHIDRMATEGMRFTDFYAAPVCTPSRARIMTGCYPARVSLPNVLHTNSETGISDDEVTLAQVLRGAGYRTGCIGKWHLGHHPRFLPTRHGFDFWFGLPYSNDMGRLNDKPYPVPLYRNEAIIERPVIQETLTERYTTEATRFIRANRNRPFFLYVAHTFPHTPLHVSERFKGKSRGGLFGDVVETIDWSTGQILQTLKDEGLDSDTVVVFTSDNGPWLIRGEHGGSALPLREGKGSTFEGGVRVPTVMRWPGHIPSGANCSQMAANFDFYPTFAKLAGAQIPTDRTIDGKDISRLMLGASGAVTPHEALYYYRSNGLEAVRAANWKLVLQHPAPGAVGRTIPQALYNLESDISETTDLSGRYPKMVARLLDLAESAREDIGDSHTGVTGANCRPCGSISGN